MQLGRSSELVSPVWCPVRVHFLLRPGTAPLEHQGLTMRSEPHLFSWLCPSILACFQGLGSSFFACPQTGVPPVCLSFELQLLVILPATRSMSIVSPHGILERQLRLSYAVPGSPVVPPFHPRALKQGHWHASSSCCVHSWGTWMNFLVSHDTTQFPLSAPDSPPHTPRRLATC